MHRRTFLNSITLSVLMAGLWINKSAASSKGFYDSQVCTALENELNTQSQLMGFQRDPIQKQNLRDAFEAIQPLNFTDLAFVVWCGERQESVIDSAKEYRSRRDNNLLAKDYYPFISMQDLVVPDSRGLFVFKEEYSAIMQETLDLFSRRQASEIVYQMYSRAVQRKCGITSINFQEHFSDLISASTIKRVGLGKVHDLFVFINTKYGKALSFTYCATIAERACNA